MGTDWLLGRTPKQRARKARAMADLKSLGDTNSPERLRSKLRGLRIRRVGLYVIPGIGWLFLGHNRRNIRELEDRLRSS